MLHHLASSHVGVDAGGRISSPFERWKGSRHVSCSLLASIQWLVAAVWSRATAASKARNCHLLSVDELVGALIERLNLPWGFGLLCCMDERMPELLEVFLWAACCSLFGDCDETAARRPCGELFFLQS